MRTVLIQALVCLLATSAVAAEISASDLVELKNTRARAGALYKQTEDLLDQYGIEAEADSRTFQVLFSELSQLPPAAGMSESNASALLSRKELSPSLRDAITNRRANASRLVLFQNSRALSARLEELKKIAARGPVLAPQFQTFEAPDQDAVAREISATEGLLKNLRIPDVERATKLEQALGELRVLDARLRTLLDENLDSENAELQAIASSLDRWHAKTEGHAVAIVVVGAEERTVSVSSDLQTHADITFTLRPPGEHILVAHYTHRVYDITIKRRSPLPVGDSVTDKDLLWLGTSCLFTTPGANNQGPLAPGGCGKKDDSVIEYAPQDFQSLSQVNVCRPRTSRFRRALSFPNYSCASSAYDSLPGGVAVSKVWSTPERMRSWWQVAKSVHRFGTFRAYFNHVADLASGPIHSITR